jgi:outer membrane protein OmpA-like peptidoglycan-associated protein
VGGKWTEPKNIGPPVNTPHWESQPAFAADGRTVYFASNRPRGAGGIDIWKTKIDDDDRFSVPENIGPPINTPGDEVSPFIHPDGKTLYFASDGHLGMGGKDIFVSRLMDNNQWSEPQNLGYPINTIGDELNLIVNAKGNIAYFSSDKEGGFGGMDLYWFELDESIRPQSVTYLKGRVFDQKDRRPIEAVVELYDLSTGELFSSIKSDVVNGEFLVCIPTNNSYALNVNKTGYLFFSENFDLVGVHSETEPYHKDIPLKNINVGEIVVLKNVFFDTDKFDLKAESILELNKLVDLLKQNKSIKIEIGGHTDNQGSQAHNKTLSQNRAKAVYEYLISKNIDKSRLTYQGYGVEKPVATNDTPQGRTLNRRTEFKIIEL